MINKMFIPDRNLSCWEWEIYLRYISEKRKENKGYVKYPKEFLLKTTGKINKYLPVGYTHSNRK